MSTGSPALERDPLGSLLLGGPTQEAWLDPKGI